MPHYTLYSLRLGRVQGSGHTTCAHVSSITTHSMRSWATYLALAISPEINPDPDEVVYRRVRPLVEKHSEKSAERIEDQSELDAAVWYRARDIFQRPFPGDANQPHQQIEDLEYRNRRDGAVQILRHKVPKYFGPDEPLDCASYLDWQ